MDYADLIAPKFIMISTWHEIQIALLKVGHLFFQNMKMPDDTAYDKINEQHGGQGGAYKQKHTSVSYTHLADGDYKSARQYARDLLAHRDSAENRIIYTDVIAESAMRGYSELEEDDKEVEGLLKEAAALREEASQYEEGDVKKDRLINLSLIHI